MPLAGCALGKHSEFPRGRELVDHAVGQTAENRTVTRVENIQTRVFIHACMRAVIHLTPFLLCKDKQMKVKMLHNQALGVLRGYTETSQSRGEGQK